MAKALRVDRTPAAPAPHHGWLAGTKRSAWRAFETCGPEDDWVEDDGARIPRRKVIKVECAHKRGTGKPARAIIRGDEDYLAEVYRVAQINPCSYTECPQWVARHPDRVR